MENKHKFKERRRLSIITKILENMDYPTTRVVAELGICLINENFELKSTVNTSKKLKLDLKGTVSDKFYNEVVKNMSDDNLKELKKLLDFSK